MGVKGGGRRPISKKNDYEGGCIVNFFQGASHNPFPYRAPVTSRREPGTRICRTYLGYSTRWLPWAPSIARLLCRSEHCSDTDSHCTLPCANCTRKNEAPCRRRPRPHISSDHFILGSTLVCVFVSPLSPKRGERFSVQECRDETFCLSPSGVSHLPIVVAPALLLTLFRGQRRKLALRGCRGQLRCGRLIPNVLKISQSGHHVCQMSPQV